VTDATLIVGCSGPVWHVTLNRPQQGNACSAELVAGLDEVLQRAGCEGAQAMVLRGAGRHFCTGFDLSAIASETDDSLLARFVRIELMLQRLARAPFLTVAVAQGRAIGAGADIFTACAVRCIDGDASFAYPGARGFGLVLGTRRLCEVVGVTRALGWIESGAAISAEEALQTSLATHATKSGFPLDELLGSILTLRDGIDRIAADSLRRAASPTRGQDDASDLFRLVESAARHGLRDRIANYIERAAARKSSPPPLSSLP